MLPDSHAGGVRYGGGFGRRACARFKLFQTVPMKSVCDVRRPGIQTQAARGRRQRLGQTAQAGAAEIGMVVLTLTFFHPMGEGNRTIAFREIL